MNEGMNALNVRFDFNSTQTSSSVAWAGDEDERGGAERLETASERRDVMTVLNQSRAAKVFALLVLLGYVTLLCTRVSLECSSVTLTTMTDDG